MEVIAACRSNVCRPVCNGSTLPLYAFFAWFFLLALCLSAPALGALEVDAGQERYDLDGLAHWQLVPPGSIDDARVTRPRFFTTFGRRTDGRLNLGFTKNELWLTLPVTWRPAPGTEAGPLQRYLYINYPHLDAVELFVVESGEIIQRETSGDHLPFSQRPVNSTGLALPVSLPPGETVRLFLRVRTESAMQLPLSLLSSEALAATEARSSLAHGMYYGIMLVMVLYNLCIFLILRDRSYLWYVLHVASFALLQSIILGHAFRYLWPGLPALTDASLMLLMPTVAVFALFFVRSFLRTRRYNPDLDQLLKLTTTAAAASALVGFFSDYRTAILTAIAVTLFVSAIILISGFVSWRRGFHSARFFLIAWLCLLPAASVHALQTAHLIPVNIATANAALIGSVLEVVLLSLALADRFRRLREKNQRMEYESSTRREATNRELKGLLLEVEQSNRLKDEFLTMVSHELRTPMNGVEGSLELLRTDHLSANQRQYIESARLCARDMTELVEAMLRFAEIQAGVVEIRRETFEIRPALNVQAVRFRKQCQRKQLRFDWHIDKAVPQYIEGDCEQLLLALRQLLGNAVKFCDHGRVSVTVSRDWDASKASDSIVFDVTDTGPGIEEKQLQQLVQAFSQLDGSNARVHPGVGLGLTISHRLVALMGGRIQLASNSGTGTSARIILPLGKVTRLFDDDDEQPAATMAHKTVLVVEDNAVNQMVLSHILQSLGCLVLTANDGQSALDTLEKYPVDLVMMDCQMPILDGYETTRRIRRSSARWRQVPVVAVTANAMSHDSGKCFSAGMNDYIKKPLQRTVVERKVRRWLGNRISAAI